MEQLNLLHKFTKARRYNLWAMEMLDFADLLLADSAVEWVCLAVFAKADAPGLVVVGALWVGVALGRWTRWFHWNDITKGVASLISIGN